MRLAITISAAAILAGTGSAWANGSTRHEDPFMRDPPKQTVYATNHHMGFSLRTTVIRWLGGVAIVDERDLRSSEREQWWGEPIPLLPADILKVSDR